VANKIIDFVNSIWR